MTLGRTLMVQGTASSVGKSLIVTALCRIYRNRGVSVAPFKAQNMSLNAAVTPDGLEIGRAQAVQAEAAGVLPRVEMNPILLKPEGDARSQLVLMGKAVGHVTASSYFRDDRSALKQAIATSLHTLRQEHELVIIEGAGSPAEINLKQRDLVNMHVARLADAPVLLVGDIDRGGVFASLLGTLDLLDADERARVAALLVNKFRGDLSLFQPGIELLTQRSGKPVLGVVPYVRGLRIADEDSQSLEERRSQLSNADTLDIAVIRLPRISNHDDVLSLEHQPGVTLRFVDRADALANADLVIVPGSKSTTEDLAWLRAQGMDRVIMERASSGAPVLGICGGCQMLGQSIDDPSAVESRVGHVAGLGLLPIRTRFDGDKITAQITAQVLPNARATFLTSKVAAHEVLAGYEIHHGVVVASEPKACLFAVQRRGHHAATIDGAVSESGSVVGTMLHGLLDNPAVLTSLLHHLRTRRGLRTPNVQVISRAAELDRLAHHVASALDMGMLDRIVGIVATRR